jgi:hypothetical protein
LNIKYFIIWNFDYTRKEFFFSNRLAVIIALKSLSKRSSFMMQTGGMQPAAGAALTGFVVYILSHSSFSSL